MEIFSRPKLGVALWTLGQMPLEKSIPSVAEMDYDGVVLPFAQIETAVKTTQLLQKNQLTCFAVSPNPVDLAHPDTAVRQAAISHVEEVIKTAVAIQAPLVTIRNLPGRFRPVSTVEEERREFETAVSHLTKFAQHHNIKIAIDVVNRYESFLCTKTAETLALINQLNQSNLQLTLSAFHMNLEEQDPSVAIHTSGEKLAMLYMADSNRLAIGQGHLKLGMHLWALESLPEVPIILECLPEGCDPFEFERDDNAQSQTLELLKTSRSWF